MVVAYLVRVRYRYVRGAHEAHRNGEGTKMDKTIKVECDENLPICIRDLARQVEGLSVKDPKANKILDRGDWLQSYPVAANGRYTGAVCGADESGFEIVDDLYCVRSC